MAFLTGDYNRIGTTGLGSSATGSFGTMTPQALADLATWQESDLAAYRTPGEDWARLSAQFSPFWQVRAPLADREAELRSRYQISAPYMQGPGGMGGGYAAFLGGEADRRAAMDAPGDLSQAGGQYAVTMEELRRRAREAALVAATPTASLFQGEGGVDLDPESEAFNRRAWLASQFRGGTDFAGAEAAQNQLNLATMLAMQRPQGGAGGGLGTAYRGQMGRAIRNAMAQIYQTRQLGGAPREGFLDWYLAQTQGISPDDAPNV
jgi:hypothetical protein